MNKLALFAGAILGLLTVALGAFGAHLFKPVLLEYERMDTFETAAKYQAYHALALLIVGVLSEKMKNKWIIYSIFSFLSGIIIFSGSLYLLSLLNMPYMGAITPIGGVLLVLGWTFLVIGITGPEETKKGSM